MIHLVYGGSGSGKSAYAEKIVMDLNTKNRYYLATMKAYGKEGQLRIQRHRELRAGKGFATLEKETLDAKPPVGSLVSKTESTILIECISNLVANEMFQDDRIIPWEKVTDKIGADFSTIKNCAENIVVVTNNIFDDGVDYDETTRNYLKALGKVNLFLADQADKVTEVVCGIPLEIK